MRLSSVSRESLALPWLLSLWKSFLLSSCCPVQCRQMVPVAAVALQLCCCTQEAQLQLPTACSLCAAPSPLLPHPQGAHAQVMGSGQLTDSSDRLDHTSPFCSFFDNSLTILEPAQVSQQLMGMLKEKSLCC